MPEISCIIWKSKKRARKHMVASITVLLSQLAFPQHQGCPISSCSSWCYPRFPINPGGRGTVCSVPGDAAASSCPESPPSAAVTQEPLSWEQGIGSMRATSCPTRIPKGKSWQSQAEPLERRNTALLWRSHASAWS